MTTLGSCGFGLVIGVRLSRYAKSDPEIEFKLSLVVVAGGGAREPNKVAAVSTVGKEDRGKKSWRILPQKPAGRWLVAERVVVVVVEEERVLLEWSRREARLMSFHTSSMNCLADGVEMTGEDGEKGEGDEHEEEDFDGDQEFPLLPFLLITVRMVG